MNNTFNLTEYIQVVKRRKWQFLLPILPTFLIIAVIAYILPATYKSKAIILIETQIVPEKMVQTTVTGYATERLQAIAQVVLARQNLLRIINELDLYPALSVKYTDQELFELMSENLTLKPVEAYIGANSNKASIAFEITFQGRNPQKVAQVINEIVSLFLEANLRDREEKAKNTVQFLKKQTEELKNLIRKKEILIAQFKARHQESLPGLYELNRSTLEKLGQQIEQQEENIRRLQDGKAYLQSQLASIPPFLPRPQSRDNDLEFLRKQYIALKATLSENHPDILALKNKIAALEKENYSSEQTRATKDDISDIQKQLAILKQKYSVNHPDYIALEKKLNELLQSKQNMG